MKNSTTTNQRLAYVDNLRIFLTGLVVLHHLAITYGASGGWYYRESDANFPEVLPYSMFSATNQAFFMGMFFFISAYFTVPSLTKKGRGQFSKDRLIRLGIPTLLFFFVLHPSAVFIVNSFIHGEEVSLSDYIFEYHIFGFGPMWFVEALMIFTLLYLLLKQLGKKISISAPDSKTIILVALLTGLGQFIIRIWLPVGWSMYFTNFQLPHFLQYIVLYGAGILAYQNNWLDSINLKMGWRWFIFVQVLIFIVFPLLFFLGGAADGKVGAFLGGMTWQNLAYAIWEQLIGFGMIVGLFGIFKGRWNFQNSFTKKLSASAYGVYVFHTPILVLISATFLDFQINQFLKFIILAPICLTLCFGFGFLLKKLPVIRNIF